MSIKTENHNARVTAVIIQAIESAIVDDILTYDQQRIADALAVKRWKERSPPVYITT